MPKTGLEPARCETHAPETCASTNSATWARFQYSISKISKYERKTGLGPATPTLARLCSTNWAISAYQIITVKRRRLELPRHNCHYPLKVARLPIPPPLQKLLFTKYLNNDKAWCCLQKKYERKTGLGPATPTLARLCSTNWAISAYFLLFIGAFLWMRVQRYYFFPNYQTFLELFLKKRCILPIFQAKTHLFP